MMSTTSSQFVSYRLCLWLCVAYSLLTLISGDCAMLNFCNGHGTCLNSTSTCKCYEGWGSKNDVTFYRAPDCSVRTCPSDRAWADIPLGPQKAHQTAECSNRGVCDRVTGQCNCFDGFTGNACQRTKCPNDCSGHGVCLSIKQLARMDAALPLGPNTYYEGNEDTTTWDEDKVYGCLCDSAWPVGLKSGQVQEPEWFSPDCSLSKFLHLFYNFNSFTLLLCYLLLGHCPSADNPSTYRVETDCGGILAKNSKYRGEPGNLCQVDCSDQGICDYSTGTCKCFDGRYGPDCAIVDPRVTYAHNRKATAAPVDEF